MKVDIRDLVDWDEAYSANTELGVQHLQIIGQEKFEALLRHSFYRLRAALHFPNGMKRPDWYAIYIILGIYARRFGHEGLSTELIKFERAVRHALPRDIAFYVDANPDKPDEVEGKNIKYMHQMTRDELQRVAYQLRNEHFTHKLTTGAHLPSFIILRYIERIAQYKGIKLYETDPNPEADESATCCNHP